MNTKSFNRKKVYNKLLKKVPLKKEKRTVQQNFSFPFFKGNTIFLIISYKIITSQNKFTKGRDYCFMENLNKKFP